MQFRYTNNEISFFSHIKISKSEPKITKKKINKNVGIYVDSIVNIYVTENEDINSYSDGKKNVRLLFWFLFLSLLMFQYLEECNF